MDNPKSPQPPELEIEPAGEANTISPATLPINDAVEPPQREPILAPIEPVSTPETAQTEPLSEPIPETGTAQMGRNEPLPESTPEAETPEVEATAKAPEIETPTPSPIPTSNASASEETPPQAEESPRTQPQTQQGTVQPEPTPTQESSAPPMPAQAPTHSIIALLLEKAKLTIQFRKQKKLVKIMTLFTKKKSITNDEVEKLLHVSDATATRYLSELEKRGKITQTGKTGHAVSYVKI